MSDVDNGSGSTFNIDLAIELADRFVSFLEDIVGRPEIEKMGITDLFQEMLNLIPSLTISDFQLSRASVPIPGYRPGIFPEDFKKISSITELDIISSQSLAVSFTIELVGLSRIKARGIGEIELYKDGDVIKVKAKDLWYIEEVQEIEPDDDKIDEKVGLLKRFIRDVVISFMVNALAVFLRHSS